MSYTTNSTKPVVRSTVFIKVHPRRQVTGWTNTSGNTWEASFDYGHVTGVTVDGEVLVEGTTLPLSTGEFLFDSSVNKVYVFSTTDPDTAKFVVVEYELNVSTESMVFFRDPTDDTSDEIYYDGVITSDPSWFQQASDILFGFFPLQSSNVGISNAFDVYTRHIYDSSWHRAKMFVYHCLGDISAENTSMVFQGYVTSFTLVESILTLEIDSIFKVFDQQFIESKQRFFNSTDFPNADPRAVVTGSEWAIRQVYGMMQGFVPVNIQHGAASTVNNRSWVTSVGITNVGTVTQLIDTGGTNNNINTTLINADGIAKGDMIRITHSVGTSYSATVTNVNYTTRVVTHTNIGARTVTAGDSVTRYYIRKVYIRDQDDKLYLLDPVTHWNVAGFAPNTKGFTLVDNFEAAVPFFPSPFDPTEHDIFCDVYGDTSILNYEVAGTPVTTVNQEGGNLNNIAAIIYAFLRDVQPTDRFEIDESSFQYAVTENTSTIGYSIPANRTATEYPTYREIFTDLLRTGLMRMQINDFNGEAAVGLSLLEPLEASPDATVDAREFSSFGYKVNYEDVYSRVRVAYNQKELDVRLITLGEDGPDFFVSDDSNTAKYLHKIDRTFEVNTFFSGFDSFQVEDYARRVMFFLSERTASISLSGRANFIRAELGQTYKLEREQLPGFDREEGEIRSRSFLLAESDKSTTDVNIRLNDQKGVEDNAGDW